MGQITKGFSQLLFCPGPVNVAYNVKRAVIDYEIGHREEEFSDLLTRIQKNLLKLYQVRHKDKYHAVIITGSGTAANEAILSSVVGKRSILVLSNGEFGERLYAISKLHNPQTKTLRWDWGNKIDLTSVHNYLKTHNVDLVAMVHHETSTGMINPVAQVGKIAKKYQVGLIVDTVSSAGAEEIKMEDWNVAFASSSASKAIASLPGASFVIGKKSEFEKIGTIPAKTTYLDLYKFYKFSVDRQQTPNTPAVSTFFALDRALQNIHDEGAKQRYAKLSERANLLREGMKKIGLTFLLSEKDMSSVLTTVNVPYGTDLEMLRDKLHEKNIIIYNGKGPLAGKVFQVGNIGEIDTNDIYYFLKGLKEVLHGLKLKTVRSVKPELLTGSGIYA